MIEEPKNEGEVTTIMSKRIKWILCELNRFGKANKGS